MSKVFVDIHALQTVPPSNLNRDDTGSPKTAVFGGTRRARVSSQAWKRAIRQDFKDYLDVSELGTRTKRVVDMIAARIVKDGVGIDLPAANAKAEEVLKASGLKLEKVTKKDKEPTDEGAQSAYLIFVSNLQAQKLAALALASLESGEPVEKKAVKAILNSDHSVDIALFGRMIADAADINVDASTQVAHAISVHPVETEFDYFTAVDDRNSEDETGAGMIGTVEFNSSTLYRYATVNVATLAENLGDSEATIKATTSFIKSFIESMPSGKQNTFANRTLPDAVVVTVRDRQPVNLVGAFEEAVEAKDGKGRIECAAERLASHARDMDEAYNMGPVRRFVISPTAATSALEALGEKVSLTKLLSELGGELQARIGDKE